jgi:7-cyano-7-deazaguanine synthase
MEKFATEGYADESLTLLAPFVNITKTDIAKLGGQIGVPFEDTWSCYEGGDVHCGKCGTCVERIEAIRDAGVTDPTVYDV